MARSQDAAGREGQLMCRVAVDILTKLSRTADKGWYSSVGVGMGLRSLHRKESQRVAKRHTWPLVWQALVNTVIYIRCT
jgi:hypothetical protein